MKTSLIHVDDEGVMNLIIAQGARQDKISRFKSEVSIMSDSVISIDVTMLLLLIIDVIDNAPDID